MAKQIIRLETSPGVNPGSVNMRVIFWFPVATPAPNPGARSAWRDASSVEIEALGAGTVIEEVQVLTFSAGLTNADIQALCQATYTARLNYLNSLPARGAFYGTFFDGAVWSG